VSLCIAAAGKVATLVVAAFTLSWNHSVEKTRWEEDWKVTPAGLELVEARVKGSGAGMEPPQNAVLKNGWWVYAPDIPPRRELALAASGAIGEGWSLCAKGQCRVIGAEAGEPAVLRACGNPDQ
jgi:hypothetical protein